jgi:hypothetical protein
LPKNHQNDKIVLGIGRKEWCGKKCDVVNHVEEKIVGGKITTCDPKEPIHNEDLGENHVVVTILSCPNHKSQIMTSWRWPLSQTIIDCHCLLLLLVVYDEHHVLKDDQKGC